jgi:endonuclease/exonuclease/phosphatase family metal-dependent hydrolase
MHRTVRAISMLTWLGCVACAEDDAPGGARGLLNALLDDADGGADLDAGPVLPSGSFLALTYNVAGLPEGLSSSQPQRFMPLIGPLLNRYDLVLLQETWLTPDPNPFEGLLRGYHEILVASSEHPYKSEPALQPFGSIRTRPTALLSDGLNLFARAPFMATERVAWPRCVATEADCLAMKGFSMSPVTLADGVVVHVYNLHAEAGNSAQDDAARAEGLQLLQTFIEENSPGEALIIAGDFNLRTDTEPASSQFTGFAAASGLTDACTALACERPGSIDKLLYRSSARVQLKAASWRIESDVFISDAGEKLSDHDPIAVRIDWSALP